MLETEDKDCIIVIFGISRAIYAVFGFFVLSTALGGKKIERLKEDMRS
jgi:hypothetical protein